MSAWGQSWGSAWGNSWGSVTPAVAAAPQGGTGGGVLGRMPRTSRNFYPNLHGDPKRLEEAQRQDEEEEALMLAVALMSVEW